MSGGYTPGPWEAVPSVPLDGYECYWIRAAQSFSPITRGFRVVDIASVNGPQWKEQEATARLIAAAPEMLEALERLYDHSMPTGPVGDDACSKALEVIRKARGST